MNTNSHFRRIVLILGTLLLLALVGTTGFRMITHAPWFDCFYLSVITLTTIGYGEIIELDEAGRIFNLFYIIFGLGVFTFCASQIIQWIVSAELHSLLERRRMEKEISKLNNHYIICGLGRMGRTICEFLHSKGKEFVVIDQNEEILANYCHPNGWFYMPGDATDDEMLKKCGIERANSLATVLSTDANNVYVVLTARMLSEKIQIIARAGDESAIQKIERAGANRVVSPYSTGGSKIARFMINPSVDDFLEIAGQTDFEMADINITKDNPYLGKKLLETDFRDLGIIIVAIGRETGERLMPPPGTAEILLNDSLFILGSSKSIQKTIAICESNI